MHTHVAPTRSPIPSLPSSHLCADACLGLCGFECGGLDGVLEGRHLLPHGPHVHAHLLPTMTQLHTIHTRTTRVRPSDALLNAFRASPPGLPSRDQPPHTSPELTLSLSLSCASRASRRSLASACPTSSIRASTCSSTSPASLAARASFSSLLLTTRRTFSRAASRWLCRRKRGGKRRRV